LRDWPKSSYVPEAQKMLGQIRGRLAKHELSVADFYIRRKHWQAAVSRLNRLLTDYPGTEYEPSALLMLGHSYVELGDKEKAREALRRLLQQFPSDTHRTEAERLLKSAA
jgi:outer membrane protein assembly factor BamD